MRSNTFSDPFSYSKIRQDTKLLILLDILATGLGLIRKV